MRTSFSEPDASSLASALVASSPRVVWIELTSKCPFDCIFCSRKQERGAGQHMGFSLYESIVAQLDSPEIIRLNYSGESVNYPRLGDAIRLARFTGATTELVSALASANRPAIEAMVDEGLHRLSVSLHSLHADGFRQIYGYRNVDDIRERIDYLRDYQSRKGTIYPVIDFAFVAMDRNLGQLGALAEYAAALGISTISVHPVIRRTDIPVAFPVELESGGTLREEFEDRIHAEAERVRARFPAVAIDVARPRERVGTDGQGIATCEQNPWETMHILADGSVVVCEVQDRTTIGNLAHESLSEIWHGRNYAQFRHGYLRNPTPHCRACPWRKSITGTAFVRGWHPQDGEGVQWSQGNALLTMEIPAGASGIRVSGMLPATPSANSLVITTGRECRRVDNSSADGLWFDTVVPVSLRRTAGPEVVRFDAAQRFCPAASGHSTDGRSLGFALRGIEVEFDRRRQKAVSRLLELLEHCDRLPRMPRPLVRTRRAAGSGVSVLIPARDTPDLLAACIPAAQQALNLAGEEGEIVAVVSGVRGCEYAHRWPDVRWVFAKQPLTYRTAVECGLKIVKQPWVYLLNSDMVLDSRALVEVLALRHRDTFAIGSQIRMRDGSSAETNWTDFRRCEQDAAELVERRTDGLGEPRGCLYVGGGSGLFRVFLLRRFVKETRIYDPFYWEDAEWGALAWRHGYTCVFCPTSTAIHAHRQTVRRYYSDAEITRIFERNRLLFHLRNLTNVHGVKNRLLSLDSRTWDEVMRPGNVLELIKARARARVSSLGPEVLENRWTLRF